MWEKFRGEKDLFGIDFASRLGSGETLNATPAPTVRIVHKDTRVDATADFGPVVVADGAIARLTLQTATGTTQAPGSYRVYVEVTTSGGRTLAEDARLYIKDKP